MSTFLRLNFSGTAVLTHVKFIASGGKLCAFALCHRNFAFSCFQSEDDNSSHSSVLFAASAPEHSSDVFSKPMIYNES